MNKNKILQELDELVKEHSTETSLQLLSERFAGSIVFSTSFGLEDQAISHIIFNRLLPVEVFTLDTGRLFSETNSTWSNTLEKYQQTIRVYYPLSYSLEKFVTDNGPNSFYESIENRKQCCFIRKVEPLQRALKNKQLWITGLRAEQSAERKNTSQFEWDEVNKIMKYHPLLHWTWKEVNDFIHTNQIPYNSLHDKGFVSIGCAPCTRAVKPGEDFRAGRWWWEDSNKKECGLHVHTELATQKNPDE